MIKNVLYIYFMVLCSICFGQDSKPDIYAKPNVEIIKIHHDSIQQAIKKGPLSFLIDPNFIEWTWYVNVNGNAIEQKEGRNLPSRKKGMTISMNKIKMKKPDGSIYYLPSKKVIIE